MNTHKRNIIIDSDPGIDDALAIFMALASDKLNILGITTVAGNVGIDQVTKNALSILTLAERSLPVCRGIISPLKAERHEGSVVHGRDGIGGVKLPEPAFGEDNRSAPEFIRDCAIQMNGDLELLTIGPLSNIAAVLHLYPKVASLIKRIVMMGGSHSYGNVSPAAEFNIYADPHAAAAVFNSGIPVDMYGLDVTRAAYITSSEIDQLR